MAITLDVIPDEERLDEETFWSQWAAVHPQLLGAVLDLAAQVMARLPAVKLTRKPRMADFARILAAGRPVKHWPDGRPLTRSVP